MMNRLFPLIAAIVLIGVASPAFADCTPFGVAGQVIYNADHKVPQFCDGTTWWGMKSEGLPTCANGDTVVMTSSGWDCTTPSGGGGCTPPPLCPNIGDVCDDSNAGTTNDPIFAGFVVYNDPNSADAGKCEALYVTNNNQSTSVQWATATGTDDIATDSNEDGKINDGQIANSSTFPAFKLCKDLTDGGFSDWYLPSRVELNLLYENQTAINANAAGAFAVGFYWASTEYDTTYAWYQLFGNGAQYTNPKTNSSGARCVRRD